MRKLILFIAFAIATTAFAQIETYSTNYEIKYEVDYLRYLNMEGDKRTSETLYLFKGPEGSVFMSYNDANKEELKQSLIEMVKKGSVDMTKSGFQNTVFNNMIFTSYSNQEIWVAAEMGKKLYTYKETATPLTWEISDETKQYENYEVQKATTSFAGRDYIAWFTLDIPIADGPYVFSGLPGLIVELYDTQEHYIFSLLSIEKLENHREWELNKTDTLSKKEFAEVRERLKRNMGIPTGANIVRMESTVVSGDKPPANPQAVVRNVTFDGKEISEAELKRMMKERPKQIPNLLEIE